jgi:hypothetical protein
MIRKFGHENGIIKVQFVERIIHRQFAFADLPCGYGGAEG